MMLFIKAIFKTLYSFSLLAFMPFRVQRKRIKRKGSRSLGPALRDYLPLLKSAGSL